MTIYFIRHAQSVFNAAFGPGKPDPMIFDAPLSQLGEEQAVLARANVKDLSFDNVIVSPFTRTIQTASLIFGTDHKMTISHHIREQLSNSCDVGSHPEVLSKNYPYLDFAHLEEQWWHEGEKDYRGISAEPHDVLMERTGQFVEQLVADSTHSTLFVSHGNFIRAVTDIQPENCEIVQFDPVQKTARSVALI